MITALSYYTVQNMLDKFRWGNLSIAQKISILNSAQEEVAVFVNTGTDRTDYSYNVIHDADEVLSPAQGAFAEFTDYMQLKFEYGEVVERVSVTAKNFTLVSSPVVSAGGIATYTITIGGSTIDGHTQIEPSSDVQASIKKVDSTSFTVQAETSHGVFSIFVKNVKES